MCLISHCHVFTPSRQVPIYNILIFSFTRSTHYFIYFTPICRVDDIPLFKVIIQLNYHCRTKIIEHYNLSSTLFLLSRIAMQATLLVSRNYGTYSTDTMILAYAVVVPEICFSFLFTFFPPWVVKCLIVNFMCYQCSSSFEHQSANELLAISSLQP